MKQDKKSQQKILFARVVLFIAIGLLALGLSRAATGAVSLQPEGGTFSGPRGGQVTKVSPIGSSGNMAVKFGLSPPNPANYITRTGTAIPLSNPIHFIDAYTDPGAQFSRIEIDTKIEAQSGNDGYYFSNYLFMPDVPSCTPDCGMYMGLQTVGARLLPPGGSVDKMAIFSVWNSTSAQPAPGVTEINFDGEGVGKSLRVAYDWVVGRTYTMVLYYNTAISTASTTYWTASVIDKTTNIETTLGNIQLTSGQKYAQSSAIFHERYSGPTNACTDMNPSQVLFSNIRAYIPSTSSWAFQNEWGIYQANVSGCNGSFWVKDLPGASFRSGINTPAP